MTEQQLSKPEIKAAVNHVSGQADGGGSGSGAGQHSGQNAKFRR